MIIFSSNPILNKNIFIEINSEIAAERLKCARDVIVLHGAGVSKSAGLPLYSDLSTAQRSLLDYDVDRRSKESQTLLHNLWKASRSAKPSLYHLFLQVLLQKDLLRKVVTFNIDDLEFDAAKLPREKVQQLHGTLSQLHCGACHGFMDTATTTWTENDGCTHVCSVPSRRPRRAQQSIQKPHFHVRMYGCDPCAALFPTTVDLRHKHESASVLIIAGCSLRTTEQKQMATDLVKHMNATGGNTIYINPQVPSKSLKRLWGPSVLYLHTGADLFAGSMLRLLSTTSPRQQHQSEWVSIKQSTIPEAGQGLFAARFIPANTRIMYYTGEQIDNDELNRRYGTKLAIYTIKVHDNLYIDAQDPKKSNVARYINTLFANDSDRAFNVVFEGQNDDRIAVRTLVDVPAGRELFADYGDEYNI